MAATKKKLEGSQPPKPVSQISPSKKRPSEKSDRPTKRPKVVDPTAGKKTNEVKETGMLPGPGKGKGLMKGQVLNTPKPPVLLRKDSQYALE